MKPNIQISAVVPIYNEKSSVIKTIERLAKVLKNTTKNFEIIAVDDGSNDRSYEILSKIKLNKLKIFRHEKNKGYGQALKTGIKNSNNDWIFIVDADGTYPIADLKKFIEKVKDKDMVVGARTRKRVEIPLIRKFPKYFILLIARFLTGEDIKDINSGMRLFRKELAIKFWHLFPDKFSFTSTLTLASHLSGYNVYYLPISYKKRIGRSTISFLDFFYFLTLIIRLVVYFNPLKFFFWPGLLFTVTGLILIIVNIVMEQNVSDSNLLVFITGLQTAFFGLIADLIVKTRQQNDKI